LFILYSSFYAPTLILDCSVKHAFLIYALYVFTPLPIVLMLCICLAATDQAPGLQKTVNKLNSYVRDMERNQ
jgi:hypothetical protein